MCQVCRVLRCKFEASQPCLLASDVVCETEHIARSGTQHVSDVFAFSPAAIDLSPKSISCYRRPDGFSGSLYELVTCHLDLRRALAEFVRDRLNV
jgi:hypothetical protein